MSQPAPPPEPVDSQSITPTGGSGIMGSVSLVSGATAISRVLGLIRVQLLAYFFGAGMAADAFFVAFRIPNLFRDLFAEGALSTAFVPVFKKILHKEGQARAQELSDKVFSLLFIILIVITLLGALFASAFVYLAAEGFREDPAKFDLAVDLTRWLFPYLFFISLSALLMGILNSYGKFGAPAFASSMFNIAMILSMLFLYDAFEAPVYCLVVGVLVGGVGQFAIQLPSLYRAGHRLRFNFSFHDQGLNAIGKLMGPIIIGLGAGRVNILVSSLLASMQGEGAVSYLVYAYQLMHFPLGVFAVAIGTVALPKASAEVADGRIDKLAGTLRSSIRMILFLVIPSTVYLAFFNDDLVRLIYQRGAFSALDAQNVQVALFWYTMGLLAFAGVRVITPVYYAFSDAKTPMRYSIWMVVLNIALSFVLVYLPPFEMGFAGLPAATALASWAQVYLLLRGLEPRGALTGWASYRESLWKTLASALVMAGALYWNPFDLSFGLDGILGKGLFVGLEVAFAGLVYVGMTVLFGLQETRRALQRFLPRR